MRYVLQSTVPGMQVNAKVGASLGARVDVISNNRSYISSKYL